MREKIVLTVAVFCAFGVDRLPKQEDMLLRAFGNSIRKAYEGNAVRLVLLTDGALDHSVYRDVFDEVFEFCVIREELLLSRAQAYLSFVERFGWESPVALLDYDTLVLKRFDHLFLSGQDIYVTTRTYAPSMPVNGGVIMLNNLYPERCYRFYQKVIEVYRGLPKKALQWWGDQIALSSVVFQSRATDPDPPAEILTLRDVRVKFLRREEFNFTPYDVDSGLIVPEALDSSVKKLLQTTVFIAHFKGPRKHLMLEWAESTSS